MGGALTIRGDIVPTLEAFAHAKGYGEITLTFEAGEVKQVEVRESMRLPDQLRVLVKRLLGV